MSHLKIKIIGIGTADDWFGLPNTYLNWFYDALPLKVHKYRPRYCVGTHKS